MPPVNLTMMLSTTIIPMLTGVIAAAANKANAIHTSGAVAWLDPDEFQRALGQAEGSLVLHSERGRSKTRHEYLASHRGLLFYTKAHRALRLPEGCQELAVKSIWKGSG